MIEITFLGTSSMAPTKDRNVQSIALRYKGEIILIDCGEGTQRQMAIAKIPKSKVRKILISHWHGDHVSGLIGLLQTTFNQGYEGELTIYGPVGSKEKIEHMLKSVVFDSELNLRVEEINPPHNEKIIFYENDDYRLEAALMNHSTTCLAYNFVEKEEYKIDMKKASQKGLKEGPEIGLLKSGKSIITSNGEKITPEMISKKIPEKKISFILDTAVNDNIPLMIKNADLVISEATFTSELEERAEVTKHMTAASIAMIASNEGVKRLVITHFSQRYKDPEPLLKDAKQYFENTTAAYDFMKIKV